VAVAELFACFGCSDILVSELAEFTMVNRLVLLHVFRYQILVPPLMLLGGSELHQFSVDKEASETAFVASSAEF